MKLCKKTAQIGAYQFKGTSLAYPNELVLSESSTTIATKARVYESLCESSSSQSRVAASIQVTYIERRIIAEQLAIIMIMSQVQFDLITLETNCKFLQKI